MIMDLILAFPHCIVNVDVKGCAVGGAICGERGGWERVCGVMYGSSTHTHTSHPDWCSSLQSHTL
jgi:hypothetical protein